MLKIIVILIAIFSLSAASVYASDAAAAKDIFTPALPINGSLCLAIGILYRQLIKANEKLYQVIADQRKVMEDVTAALTSLRNKLDK